MSDDVLQGEMQFLQGSRSKADEIIRRKIYRHSMLHHLGRDLDAEEAAEKAKAARRKEYEDFVRNVLRIPRPIADPPWLIANVVIEGYWKGEVSDKGLFSTLAEVSPLIDATALGKIFQKALDGPKPKALSNRPGAPRGFVQHVLLVAYQIKSHRPELIATKGSPSNPKLAELTYRFFRVAGAPEFLFKNGSDTVLRWLRQYRFG